MIESGMDTTQAAAEQASARLAGATARRGPSWQIAIVVAILGGGVLFTAMAS